MKPSGIDQVLKPTDKNQFLLNQITSFSFAVVIHVILFRLIDSMSEEKQVDDFWPTLITLLATGCFIFWVMTVPEAQETLYKYVFRPVINALQLGPL